MILSRGRQCWRWRHHGHGRGRGLTLDRAAAAAFDVRLHWDLNWPFDVAGKKVMKAAKMKLVPPSCLNSVY